MKTSFKLTMVFGHGKPKSKPQPKRSDDDERATKMDKGGVNQHNFNTIDSNSKFIAFQQTYQPYFVLPRCCAPLAMTALSPASIFTSRHNTTAVAQLTFTNFSFETRHVHGSAEQALDQM